MRAPPAPELRRSPEANPGPRTADTGGQPRHRRSTFNSQTLITPPKNVIYSTIRNYIYLKSEHFAQSQLPAK